MLESMKESNVDMMTELDALKVSWFDLKRLNS